jgi:hypothetical protein
MSTDNEKKIHRFHSFKPMIKKTFKESIHTSKQERKHEFREVCECFLNRLLESSESVVVFFIAYLYEWTL